MLDSSPLTAPPVASADELRVRLELLQAALPLNDGLACFARMYQLVTSAIAQGLAGSVFEDEEWLSQLDVVFGNLFLEAVRTSVQAPEQTPRAWAPVIERRGDPTIRPLQFALAGLNAHINRDLPPAIVATCIRLGTSPAAGSHHADFFRVNAVLAEVGPTIRASLEGALLSAADRLLPGLQDLLANFNIVKARETAWTNSETLWLARQFAPDQGAAYSVALDRITGLAGRGFLVRLSPPG